MRRTTDHVLLLPIAAVLLAVAPGCRGTADNQRAAAVAAGHLPILVLMPLADRTETETGCGRQFGDCLYQELSEVSAAQAVRAEQIGALTGTVNHENLVRNGDFCPVETAALGRLAQCRSVVAAQVLEFRPYPPQMIALRLVWIAADSSQLLRRVHLRMDLGDTRIREDYTRFVHRNQSEIRRVVMPESGQSYLETALLSPRLFHRFVAQCAVRALAGPNVLTAPAPATGIVAVGP